ncbi:probable aspartic proteinase GIP2 [Spinacia oleracea]|uniref:Probable aspartic proteinase GIP2 n=1 Tax=Spinacia oleracea TaxID=3562 RepID=A0A9R0HT98_SPIOL|nr:probable aspartic proteinase GIP2 [Spinacia oleracea]
MASAPFLLSFLLICSAFSLHFSNANFVLPVVKDTIKSQYYTSLLVGNHPSTRVYLVIDLGNQWSWFACDLYGYNTTSHELPCDSPKCELYAPGTFCSAGSCGVDAYTPWSRGLYSNGLLEDTTRVYKQTKQNSLAQVLSKADLPNFPFTCANKGPLKGLSPHTKGVVTLARVLVSLHSQISSTFKVPRKFALCLPSSTSSGYNGAIYFGGSPDYLSKSLITTPLVINPNSTSPIYSPGDASVEYFIKVRSIKVDGTPIRFSPSLLSFDIKEGVGGTKISTMDPYTVLHSEIYKTLVNVFVTKATAMKMTRVASVAPFGVCFSSKSVVNNAKTGPTVPIIDIIMDGKSPLLHNKNARWRIYGANSMVKVSDSVMCLGFVDGGLEPVTSIVIGGKQMEDNLVEIDLETSKLGVTSSLLRMGTNCSKFKGI